MAAQEVPQSAVSEAAPLERETKREKFRGYESFHPAFVNAAVALISKCGFAERLAEGDTIDAEEASRVAEPRFLQASLDFLVSQGFLVKNHFGNSRLNEYVATENGRAIFAHAEIAEQSVATYEAVIDVVQDVIRQPGGEGGDEAHPIPLSPMAIKRGEKINAEFLEAWVVPAVTAFHELRFLKGKFSGERVSDILVKGETIDVRELGGKSLHEDIPRFIFVLGAAELLTGELPKLRATARGKKVFELGGYAELVASYFSMLQNLHPLTEGKLTYGHGLGGDVYRYGDLNARASNGIIKTKVAPAIVRSLDEVPCLREALGDRGTYVDYGSGGGDMLLQVAHAKDSAKLPHLFGVDINGEALTTAQRVVREAGIENRFHFIEGSILSQACLETLGERVRATGNVGIVASINYILHEFSRDDAARFLRLHSATFKDAPLIITETFRMPPEVLRAHPNYQAPSFQFMHDASGQNLFEERELLMLLGMFGYKVRHRIVHSSMPGVNPGERHDTIVTLVVQKTV